MHIRLTEEYTATSRLYRAEVMEGHYNPPGPEFRLDDEGRRVANLRKEVAQALIDLGIAERVDDETDETDDSGESDTDESDGDAADGDADGADESEGGDESDEEAPDDDAET